MFLEYDETSATGFRTKSFANKIDMVLQSRLRQIKVALRVSLGFNIGLIVVSIVLLVLVIRGNTNQTTSGASIANVLQSGDEFCSPMYNTDGIAVTGSACVSVDSKNNMLVRIIRLGGSVTLNSSRVWLGTNLATMPKTADGSPNVDAFPYQNNNNFTVSLNALGYNPTIGCSRTTVNIVAFAQACGSSNQCTSGYGGDLFLRPNQFQERYMAFTLDCPNQALPLVQSNNNAHTVKASNTGPSGKSLIVCIRGFISAGPGVYTYCDQLIAKYNFTSKLYLNWRDRPDFVAGPENAADPNPPYNNGDWYLGGLDLPATAAHIKLVNQVINGSTLDFFVIVGHSYGGASAYFLATEGVVQGGVPQPDLLFLIDPVFNYAAGLIKGPYFASTTPARYQTINWYQRNGAWLTEQCTTNGDKIGLCIGGLADFNPCGNAMSALGVCDIQMVYQKSNVCQPESCTSTYCEFFAQWFDHSCQGCGIAGCQYPSPGKQLINHVLMETDDCIWTTIFQTIGQYQPCSMAHSGCNPSPSCPMYTMN